MADKRRDSSRPTDKESMGSGDLLFAFGGHRAVNFIDPQIEQSEADTARIASSQLASHTTAQGNYTTATGTLTQFNGIMAAVLSVAMAGGDASLKIAASCSVLLHVLAAFQLCWAARPLEPERARSQIMALFTSESLVNDTFKHYRRGWRFTLVALAVSSATLALFVLSAAGIDTADMLAQLARWPRR